MYKATLYYTVQGDREQDLPMLGQRDANSPEPAQAAADKAAADKPAADKAAANKAAGGKAAAEPAAARPAEKAPTVFLATIPSIVKPIKYRIEIGDSQTRGVHRRRPRKAHHGRSGSDLPLSGLPGPPRRDHRAEDGRPGGPAVHRGRAARSSPPRRSEGLHADRKGSGSTGAVEHAGKLVVVKLPLLKDGSFTINLFNDAGHSDPDPRLNHVQVIPDLPPAVQLLKPGRQISTVAPGERRAGDDPRHRRSRRGPGAPGDEGRARPPSASGDEADRRTTAPPRRRGVNRRPRCHEWTKFDGTTNVLLTHRLELDKPTRCKPGQTVMIRAVAWDKRDFRLGAGPQARSKPASDWHSIRVIAEEAQGFRRLEQLDDLREQVLEDPRKADPRPGENGRHPAAQRRSPNRAAEAGDVRTTQFDIQKKAVAVVASIGNTDKEERLAIKRVFNQLAVGEMVEAVRQCDELVKVKAAGRTSTSRCRP